MGLAKKRVYTVRFRYGGQNTEAEGLASPEDGPMGPRFMARICEPSAQVRIANGERQYWRRQCRSISMQQRSKCHQGRPGIQLHGEQLAVLEGSCRTATAQTIELNAKSKCR
jgi:hypothetical protein